MEVLQSTLKRMSTYSDFRVNRPHCNESASYVSTGIEILHLWFIDLKTVVIAHWAGFF